LELVEREFSDHDERLKQELSLHEVMEGVGVVIGMKLFSGSTEDGEGRSLRVKK
jgi:hypothetical protein